MHLSIEAIRSAIQEDLWQYRYALTLTTLGFFAISYVIGGILYYRHFHPLARFPGPFWASITNVYMVLLGLTGHEHEIYEKLHARYGSVVRIGPNLLMFTDPTLLPVIYNRKADKSTMVYGSGMLGKTPSVFQILSHEQHQSRKRKMAHFYAMSAVKPMEGLLDARITEWIDTLRERHEKTNTPLDFASWAQWLSFDVISELAFGKPVGFTKSCQDIRGLIRSMHETLPLVLIFSRMPALAKFIRESPLLYKYLMPNPTNKSGVGYFMGFRDELIQERMHIGSPTPRVDLLQSFLNGTESNYPDVDSLFTIDEVKAESLIVLLAGSDTAAGVLRSFILNIFYYNRQCYEKAIKEIDNALGPWKPKLSRPIAKYDEIIKHLPYLSACIKETLRLTPPILSLTPRNVPAGGFSWIDPDTGKNWHIPEGVQAAQLAYLTHRDKKLYGADARVFKPERWIPRPESMRGDIEKIKEMERYDFSFGFGSRTCLGKNIALVELWKVIAEFLIAYDVRFINGEVGADGKVEKPVCNHRAYGISIHSDMWMRIKAREDTWTVSM